MSQRAQRTINKYAILFSALLMHGFGTTNIAEGLQVHKAFKRILREELPQTNFTFAPQESTVNSIEPDDSTSIPSLVNQSASQSKPTNSIEYFENLATQNHPRLVMLLNQIDAARAESLQQSVRVNPQVGIFGDEMFNSGQIGLYGTFINETHVPLAKRQHRSNVKCREADLLASQLNVARQQILTDVRTAFYSVLIAQRQFELTSNLAEAYSKAINNTQQLIEGGEATQSDRLRLEVQYQRTLAQRAESEAYFLAAWRELAALSGDASMIPDRVEGTLDTIAEPLNFEAALQQLVSNSPELQVLQSKIQLAAAVVERERANALPNTQTQWTLGRDSGTEDVFMGFQVSVPWQKYNRNQGNISAAQKKLMATHSEVELKLRDLARRLAQEFSQYEVSMRKADIYAREILPKAQQAIELVDRSYQGGEASFLELLTAQRTLINTTNEYLTLLKTLWLSRQKIEGLLLSDSLVND